VPFLCFLSLGKQRKEGAAVIKLKGFEKVKTPLNIYVNFISQKKYYSHNPETRLRITHLRTY